MDSTKWFTTTTIEAASAIEWDVVVVGAGVAGALAAGSLAEEGLRVLLVESKPFPREKVCGGCLNQRAQQILRRAGLLDSLLAAGAIQLDHLQLAVGSRRASWPMPRMISVSRSLLDSLLVTRAIRAGAQFLPETTARILDERDASNRQVELSGSAYGTAIAQARAVLIADGLAQSSLARLTEFRSRASRDSRIGVQAFVPCSNGQEYPSGSLFMAVSSHGYVGVAKVDGERLDIAAAIDPSKIPKAASKLWEGLPTRPREAIDPRELPKNASPIQAVEQNETLDGFAKPKRIADLVEQILVDCRMPQIAGLHEANWRATPALTRRSPRVGGYRLLLVGDSLGYIEPFTGEGMSWALAGSEHVVPILVKAIRDWPESTVQCWQTTLEQKVINNQWMCQLLKQTVRRPRLARWAMCLCHWIPALRNQMMRQVSGQ